MEAVSIASEDLCVNIEKAASLVNQLTEISLEKEAFLTAGDIEGLRRSTEAEEEIIAALSRLEKDRKICADALSQAIGLFNRDIKLTDIIENIADSAIKARLTDLRSSFLDAADKLAAQNDKLGQLLQMQIGFTDYMINLLYVPKKRNHTYDPQGSRRDEPDGRSLMDLHI